LVLLQEFITMHGHLNVKHLFYTFVDMLPIIAFLLNYKLVF